MFREFSKRGSSRSGFYTANVWNDLNGAKRLNDWNDWNGLESSRGTGHLLRLQGQERQQLLDASQTLQTVYPLYDSLGP